jgi:hypothetical protein
MMERPNVVWVFSILVVFGILNSIYNAVPALTASALASSPVVFYATVLSLLALIPAIVFIYKFFMLRRDSLIWLYISFGLKIVLSLIATKWITAVITAGFGWVVWDYIAHKKIGHKQLFK